VTRRSGISGFAQKKLADQDSNLDKQNQNLLCYRYTIGQSGSLRGLGAGSFAWAAQC
jgi:hypothetical protein